MQHHLAIEIKANSVEFIFKGGNFKDLIEKSLKAFTHFYPGRNHLLNIRQSVVSVWEGLQYRCMYREDREDLVFEFKTEVLEMHSFPLQMEKNITDKLSVHQLLQQQFFLHHQYNENDAAVILDRIIAIDVSPLNIEMTFRMPKFIGWEGIMKFGFSRILYCDLMEIEDRNLKMVVQCDSFNANLLRELPINYGYYCANTNLYSTASLIYNTYIPSQILQNVLSEKFRSQDCLRQTMSFLPTRKFGIFTFGFKPEYGNNIFQLLQQHHLVFFASFSFRVRMHVVNEVMQASITFDESHVPFLMAPYNLIGNIKHKEYCNNLQIPEQQQVFNSLKQQLSKFFENQPNPDIQQSESPDTFKLELPKLDYIEKFFIQLITYGQCCIFKYIYLGLCHQIDGRLSCPAIDRIFCNQTVLSTMIQRHILRILRQASQTQIPQNPNIQFHDEGQTQRYPFRIALHNMMLIALFGQDSIRKIFDPRRRTFSSEGEDRKELGSHMTKLYIAMVECEEREIRSQSTQNILLAYNESENKLTYPFHRMVVQMANNENLVLSLILHRGQTREYCRPIDSMTDSDRDEFIRLFNGRPR